MANVIASFTTKPQEFPVGTTGSYLLTLIETSTGAVLTGTGQQGDTSVSIKDVPAGTYSGSISLVDASGNALAPAIGDPVPLVISAPATVTLNVPAALTMVAA